MNICNPKRVKDKISSDNLKHKASLKRSITELPLQTSMY